ncbi:MAG: hypothetical protein JJW01_02515 [Alphaproteobacteria bacterium]|nr:hypothetical protein [Rickettsiales bacterium]
MYKNINDKNYTLAKNKKEGKDSEKNILFLPKEIGSFVGNFFDGLKILFDAFLSSSSNDLISIKKNSGKGGRNNMRLGILHYKEGNIALSMIRLFFASKFAPRSILPHLYLFKCFLRIENLQKAKKHYIVVLQLKPRLKNRLTKILNNFFATHPDRIHDFSRLQQTLKGSKNVKNIIAKNIRQNAILSYIDSFIINLVKVVDYVIAFFKALNTKPNVVKNKQALIKIKNVVLSIFISKNKKHKNTYAVKKKPINTEEWGNIAKEQYPQSGKQKKPINIISYLRKKS